MTTFQSEEDRRDRLSLGTVAARTLATTTKTPPQMQAISPRWLLRMLPWVEASAGSYRVNRRRTYALGDGRVSFSNIGDQVSVLPPELRELPALRDFDDDEVLAAVAERFVQRQYASGEVITTAGQSADQVVLLAHGKVNTFVRGRYDRENSLTVLADGAFLGDQVLTGAHHTWPVTTKTLTPCIVLTLSREDIAELTGRSETLRTHLERVRDAPAPPQNKHGEAAMLLASGHVGETELPATFAEYELRPREYQLSVAQTVLRVHTRVADVYSEPFDQLEQQLRLTIEELRERQESELINNSDFGLLHNADLRQRIQTGSGPPRPGDLDELLARRRRTEFFLAHPRTIAAFGRECSRAGVHPESIDVHGSRVTAWRGVPLLPCDKIPVTGTGTSSIIAMRTGEDRQGVVGLRQTGIPDEYVPGLNVRFMGINDKAVTSYLVSTYYAVAVLTPDALGVLDNVEVSR